MKSLKKEPSFTVVIKRIKKASSGDEAFPNNQNNK